MLVRERMSTPAITVHEDTQIPEALNLMRSKHIRRLPVVDKKGKLVGIVSERNLMQASPSQATSLSIWEMNYLLSKITVKQLMSKEIVTVGEDTPLEEAARIMADMHISGLPVLKGDDLVGIITETDIFKTFVELLGAREKGLRVTMRVHDQPGELVKITQAIFNKGGNIIALATFYTQEEENRVITIKVENITPEQLREAVEPYVEKIVDLRVI